MSVAGDDLSSLRPYVPGDHLNRLHWPALARTGELVVRDFTAPESGRLALLVDLRPSAHGASSFEAAIARVAALGSRALTDGVAVELCTSAGERLEIPAGTVGRQALVRALALLGPTNPPTSSALRWTGSTPAARVWAASGVGDSPWFSSPPTPAPRRPARGPPAAGLGGGRPVTGVRARRPSPLPARRSGRRANSWPTSSCWSWPWPPVSAPPG